MNLKFKDFIKVSPVDNQLFAVNASVCLLSTINTFIKGVTGYLLDPVVYFISIPSVSCHQVSSSFFSF